MIFSPIETYRQDRGRSCCNCTQNGGYKVRDFQFVFDLVQDIHLIPRQKNMLLRRYVHIMDKVKVRFGAYAAWYTCSKTFLIIGNISVPSIMSVQALLSNNDTAWTVLFWAVWAISIAIAIISSFVTFCNTQKKYNLFNQFNTKIQRELWAYLTLTGRYRVTKRHLSLMGFSSQNNEENERMKMMYYFDMDSLSSQSEIRSGRDALDYDDNKELTTAKNEASSFNDVLNATGETKKNAKNKKTQQTVKSHKSAPPKKKHSNISEHNNKII